MPENKNPNPKPLPLERTSFEEDLLYRSLEAQGIQVDDLAEKRKHL
jgi:hypothetical protein